MSGNGNIIQVFLPYLEFKFNVKYMKTRNKSLDEHVNVNGNVSDSKLLLLIRPEDFGGTDWFSKREVINLYIVSQRSSAEMKLIRA